MSLEWIMSACLGVGLAACCGFRVFIPLLIASASTKLGFIGPVAGFEWIGSWSALLCLAVATCAELGAYYIPWLDNALDTLATPTSIIAGTLLSTSFLPIDTPVLHWGLGLLLGGSSAGIVQAGTSLLRLGSTATTAGVANPVVATGENVASFGFSLFAVFLPLAAAAILFFIVLFIISQLVSVRKVWFTKGSAKPAGNSTRTSPSNGGRQ